jgi:hypothetical protein
MIQILSTGEEHNKTCFRCCIEMRSAVYINTTTFPSPDKYHLGIQALVIKYLFFLINYLLEQRRKWLPEQDHAASLVTWATRNKLYELKLYTAPCEILSFCHGIDGFFALPDCYRAYINYCLKQSSGHS